MSDRARSEPPQRPDESLADAEIASYVARASAPQGREAVSALSAFQRTAEQYPQLSAKAQSELHLEYVKGEEARKALAKGSLRGRAVTNARKAVARSEYAMAYLVGSNFRLALLIARENAEARLGRERAMGRLPDLVAEANLALTEAVTTFDPKRSPTFSTYAARVIRDRVRMVLTSHGAMSLPPSWKRIKRIASVRIAKLTDELGRPPSREELQAALLETCMTWAYEKLTDEQKELPAEEQKQLAEAKLRKQGMLGAIRDIDQVRIYTQNFASLDAPVGEDGSASLGDLLGTDDGDHLFDHVELDEVRAEIANALAALTDRERDIVLRRYGFIDGECWTYARISEDYGVTAERIRQLEKNVLAKLRNPASPHAQRLGAHLPVERDMDGR